MIQFNDNHPHSTAKEQEEDLVNHCRVNQHQFSVQSVLIFLLPLLVSFAYNLVSSLQCHLSRRQRLHPSSFASGDSFLFRFNHNIPLAFISCTFVVVLLPHTHCTGDVTWIEEERRQNVFVQLLVRHFQLLG